MGLWSNLHLNIDLELPTTSLRFRGQCFSPNILLNK